MADNISVDTITGDPVLATDEVGGFHYTKNKIYLGAESAIAGPIDGGTGAAAATTIRIVTASNDPGVSHLSSLAGAVNGAGSIDVRLDDVTELGTITEYVVDEALGVSPTGRLVVARRVDTLSTVTPIADDAVDLRVNAEGALWVKHSGTITVDGSGVTQPVSATDLDIRALASGTDSVAAVQSGAWTVTATATNLDIRDLASGTDSVSAVQSGTWTVTANAGTNLNTSALALETGGNLDTAVTHLTTLAGAVSGAAVQADVLTQPARSHATDTIGAGLLTDVLLDGTTSLTPKFAIIDANISGDNEIIAAVATKKIRIISGLIIATDDAIVQFLSSTAGAISGPLPVAARGGFQIPFCPIGNFETVAGEALDLNISGAIQCSGWLTYVEVD